MRDKDKEKKRESAMTHESIASITREREKKQEKEEGWRERKMEILFWFSSFILSFFFFNFLFDEIIFFSFRCSFCTWVHRARGLLLSFLLVFFFFKESLGGLF